jgi:hypothetical protein
MRNKTVQSKKRKIKSKKKKSIRQDIVSHPVIVFRVCAIERFMCVIVCVLFAG